MQLSAHDLKLMTRLNRHPALRERMERLLEVVENAAGDARLADEAEQRVIEELRRLGADTLTAWAETRLVRHTESELAKAEGRSAGKKNSIGTRRSAR